jgi:hypothetical protein
MDDKNIKNKINRYKKKIIKYKNLDVYGGALMHENQHLPEFHSFYEYQHYIKKFNIEDKKYFFTNKNSYVAITTSGDVIAWGCEKTGGHIPSNIINKLKDINYIYSNDYSYAALLNNGQVFVWGDPDNGGTFNNGFDSIENVVHIFNNSCSYVALLKNGKIKTWGNKECGGELPEDLIHLINIKHIYSNEKSYVALLTNGKINAWGDKNNGGFIGIQHSLLKDIYKIFCNKNSYVALTDYGKIFNWGNIDTGGNNLNDVIKNYELPEIICQYIFSNDNAFAAQFKLIPINPFFHKEDNPISESHRNRIFFWGNLYCNSENVVERYKPRNDMQIRNIFNTSSAFAILYEITSDTETMVDVIGDVSNGGSFNNEFTELKNVVHIFNNSFSFAALLSTGEVKVWGNPDKGGLFNNGFTKLYNVIYIYNSEDSYAALLSNGEVKVWGNKIICDSFNKNFPDNSLRDIIYIFNNNQSYAVLLISGEIKVFGNENYGGKLPNDELSNVLFLNPIYYSNLLISLPYNQNINLFNYNLKYLSQLKDINKFLYYSGIKQKHLNNYIFGSVNDQDSYYIYNPNNYICKYLENDAGYAFLKRSGILQIMTIESELLYTCFGIDDIFKTNSKFITLSKNKKIGIYNMDDEKYIEWENNNYLTVFTTENNFVVLNNIGQIFNFENTEMIFGFLNGASLPIIYIFTNQFIFAALTNDNQIFVFGGGPEFGGQIDDLDADSIISNDSYQDLDELHGGNGINTLDNVDYIFDNNKLQHKFVALLKNGQIKSWGKYSDITNLQINKNKKEIKHIYSNTFSNAILYKDGEVLTFGLENNGGDLNNPQFTTLNNVVKILPNKESYLALTSNGEIKIWGNINDIKSLTHPELDLNNISYIFPSTDRLPEIDNIDYNTGYFILQKNKIIFHLDKGSIINKFKNCYLHIKPEILYQIINKYNINDEFINKCIIEIFNKEFNKALFGRRIAFKRMLKNIWDDWMEDKHLSISIDINLQEYCEKIQSAPYIQESFSQDVGIDQGGLTKQFFSLHCLELKNKYLIKLDNDEYIIKSRMNDTDIEKLYYYGYCVGRMIVLNNFYEMSLPFKFHSTVIYQIINYQNTKNYNLLSLKYVNEKKLLFLQRQSKEFWKLKESTKLEINQILELQNLLINENKKLKDSLKKIKESLNGTIADDLNQLIDNQTQHQTELQDSQTELIVELKELLSSREKFNSVLADSNLRELNAKKEVLQNELESIDLQITRENINIDYLDKIYKAIDFSEDIFYENSTIIENDNSSFNHYRNNRAEFKFIKGVIDALNNFIFSDRIESDPIDVYNINIFYKCEKSFYDCIVSKLNNETALWKFFYDNRDNIELLERFYLLTTGILCANHDLIYNFLFESINTMPFQFHVCFNTVDIDDNLFAQWSNSEAKNFIMSYPLTFNAH